jgi:PleD family two-component response regulator
VLKLRLRALDARPYVTVDVDPWRADRQVREFYASTNGSRQLTQKSDQHCSQCVAVNRSDVPTVLIVEDNRDLAEAIAEVLRSIGYSTLIAHDGEAALSSRDFDAEIVILDLNCRRD